MLNDKEKMAIYGLTTISSQSLPHKSTDLSQRPQIYEETDNTASSQRVRSKPRVPQYVEEALPIGISLKVEEKEIAFSRRESKKIYYSRDPKYDRASRDSGIGSSSASDGASLSDASLHELPFTYRRIQDQRHTVTALQEALDAANNKVRQLEANNARLAASLTESNKEALALTKERLDLEKKNYELMDDLKEQRRFGESLRGEKIASSSTSRTERKAPLSPR